MDLHSRSEATRIIPARAGFTIRVTVYFDSGEDHPRSRGVYHKGIGKRSPKGGSSPLARGLRVRPMRDGEARGIIPARAGFTRRPVRRGRRRRDHPRSRGVYTAVVALGATAAGSSPLARGLPGALPEDAYPVRIIPARAGFTRWRRLRAFAGPGSSPLARGLQILAWLGQPTLMDHPRSRGVYICGSLVSQRTRSLPDPRRLHCRPRARSAGSP